VGFIGGVHALVACGHEYGGAYLDDGLPSEFGKDGRVNKAVHKDVQELLEECDPVIFDAWCSYGRETTPECIEACRR
jgi:hypothetical protein